MATITFAESFATSKKYVRIQGRVCEDKVFATATLHLQGKGPEGNRDYGFATNVSVPAEIGKWLQEQDAVLPSLAGSTPRYVPMQVRFDEDLNAVRFQVGGEEHNRSYGAAFILSESAPGIEPLVTWLKNNQ